MKAYEPFPHQSDIGLTIYGDTLERLFENAGFAVFDSLCNLRQVRQIRKVEVIAHGDDREELLVNFMNELLYLQGVKGWLFRRFEVRDLSATTVKANAWGEPYDPKRHELFHEIKGATYHNLHVRQENGTWKVDMVFDV